MGIVVGNHVVEWVARQTNPCGYFGNGVGIGWERDGKLTGGAVFMNWNGVNIDVHIASDRTAQWLVPGALQFAFAYPFIQLGARRITAAIGEGNRLSRSFAERLGFILEAKLHDAHPTGALCIYAMHRANCRFIQQKARYG